MTIDYAHVDAVCMWMVKNPEWFDVIVTDNLFGDIITDLGAMIQGRHGHRRGREYQSSGGFHVRAHRRDRPPNIPGQNIINPLAAIGAAQMMLEQLGLEKPAQKIEQAIRRVVLEKVKDLTAGKMGYTTQEVGDLVVQYL